MTAIDWFHFLAGFSLGFLIAAVLSVIIFVRGLR